ncbi:MAG: TIR domain-containing protein [Terracidiphilus sp.]|jgi:predicted nucleotide-binding protein
MGKKSTWTLLPTYLYTLDSKECEFQMANRKMNTDAAQNSGGGADFPKHSLQAALRVPQALEGKNSGNPMAPTDVAIAIDKSPGSSDFRVLLSSSIKYGLSMGSYNQSKVALTPLASDIVAPTSDEARNKALFQSALTPSLFKRIFEAYRGRKVPDMQFFQNALVRDFGVVRDQAAKCAAIFYENAEFLGLVRQATTGKWLASEPTGIATMEAPEESEDGGDENAQLHATEQQRSPLQDPGDLRAPTVPPAKNAIFIGHGKNRAPLQQLEKFLLEFKIPHRVVVDEANKGRPISQKVAESMHECGAAIIIFTADEEFKDLNGQVIFRPSENAIFELGAASALYGSRVVIFKEVGVTFPTNFRDIGYIEFEKDRLDAKVSELFRELIAFKLITVSVQ